MAFSRDKAVIKEKIEMSGKIKVGIIGCGFVGGALKTWIEENKLG